MPLDEHPASANGAAVLRHKQVTVLFADIVASSALVAGRDPEDADDILRPILDLFSGAVERSGGLVAQVVGDGILAVFGTSPDRAEDAVQACLAAQSIIRAVRARPDRGLPIAVRIGIASGIVVMRPVHTAACRDLRIVGECVHLAAKLQQRAAPGTILIAPETLGLTQSHVSARPAGALRLSANVSERRVYQLLEARPVPIRGDETTNGAARPCGPAPFIKALIGSMRFPALPL